MHRLLARQLQRLGATPDTAPRSDAWRSFLADVSAVYELADQDRHLLERSLELTSDELVERNGQLQSKVDDQARIMNELHAALSLHEATLEATDDGILVVDPTGMVSSANRRFSDMWRLPPAVVGTDTADLIRQVLEQLVDPEAFQARITDIYGAPHATSFDVVEMLDGRIYERFSRPQVLDDRVVGRVWSFRDVTEARRSRTQLEVARSRLVSVVSNTPITVFAADPAGLLTVVEGHGLAEIGLSPDSVGGSVFDVCQSTPDVVDAVRGAMSGTTCTRILELGGGVFDLYLAPTYDTNGRVDGVTGVAHDITERWELERQAKRHHEQLTRTARLSSLGTLVAGVAHEINNPLMYMKGHLDLVAHILGESSDGHAVQMRGSVAKVREGTERIGHIARSLKVFASGTNTEKVPVDLAAVLDEVAALVAVDLPPGVVVERTGPATPAWIRGNAVQIHQVVLNILQNAIHAVTPGQGSVTLGVTVDGGHVMADIADDGPGMPPEVQTQAFTPFFTTKENGTGMGLALANTVVKEHGGSITFDSGPSGTRFFLRFPLALAAAASLPEPSATTT